MIGIDIKMPIDCAHCPMDHDTYGSGYCLLTGTTTNAVRFVKRSDNCPLHPLDNKIRVGDEVYNNIVGFNGIVTFVWPDGDVDVVAENGRAITWGKGDSIERTGRHFDEIATLLWKMRGEDDA